jgi:hypothetical protein
MFVFGGGLIVSGFIKDSVTGAQGRGIHVALPQKRIMHHRLLLQFFLFLLVFLCL